MQIPIEIIVLGLAAIFIISMMLAGTEFMIPMYVRTNFDDICSKYLAVIEKNGGLSEEDRIELVSELNNIGISNISISAPNRAEWGTKVELKIEGDYIFITTNFINLSKKSESKRIVYDNKTVVVSLS